LSYHLNVDDEIKGAKLVFMDNTVELGNDSKGEVSVNFSEKVDKDEIDCIKELYIEFEMASGYTYQIYPLINASLTYELQGDGMDKTETISQNEELNVITDNGKLYQMPIGW